MSQSISSQITTGQLPGVFVGSGNLSRLDTWTSRETELTEIFCKRKYQTIANV